MDSNSFKIFRDKFNQDCEKTLINKGKTYTRGTDDRFTNFKKCAEDLGLTPQQVWTVYWHKHLDAIFYYLKTGQEGPEGIRENFKDLRNYLDLGLGLIMEEQSPLIKKEFEKIEEVLNEED